VKQLLIPAAIAAMFSLSSDPALAGAQQGVRCPSGFTAEISDGNRKLVCSKTATYQLDSICSPVLLGPSGAKGSANVVMEPTGSDTCLAAVTGNKVPSVMSPPQPGYPPASSFTRQVNPSGPDKFVSTRKEYKYPEAGPVYVGDASNGVKCPSGYDGDKVHDGKGIRCDKYDGPPKPADCDGIGAGPVAVGWQWKQDHASGGEDRCVPVGTGPHGPTKPQGMTKVQHDLERQSDEIGWVLDKKSGARDTWQRKVYKFPDKL
jgi:hypothetical protein